MSGEELKPAAWLYRDPASEENAFLAGDPFTSVRRWPAGVVKAQGWTETPLYAHPLPEQPQEGWRTIDSAPKDWTDVMVFSPDHGSFNCGGVFSAFFDAESGDWMTHGIGANMELNPTHWMPLPSPPSTETKESGDA